MAHETRLIQQDESVNAKENRRMRGVYVCVCRKNGIAGYR